MMLMSICYFMKALQLDRKCNFVRFFYFTKSQIDRESINFVIYRTLTEKIVAALPKMKCPYLIEPHQIQGLDFINIFPVIQWLVKRSVCFKFSL